MRFFIYFFSLIVVQSLYGQSGTFIGSWRQHPSPDGFEAVCNAGNYIYAGSAETLVRYSLEDNEVRTLSKNEGLSDVGISCLGYSRELDIMVIGYSNGNIDLIKNNHLMNIGDIKRSNAVLGSKRLNHVAVRDGIAYISTDFGLVLVDLLKNEIRDAAINISQTAGQLQVNSSCIYNDSIYIATANGVFVASLDVNLLDYNSWRLYTVASGLPAGVGYNSVLNYKGNLFALCNRTYGSTRELGSLYKLSDGRWTEEMSLTRKVTRMYDVGDRMLIGGEGIFYEYDGLMVDSVFVPGTINEVVESRGILFLASGGGLLRFEHQHHYYFIGLSSMSSSNAFRVINANGTIFNLYGGYNANTTNKFRQHGMDIWHNGSWVNYSSFAGNFPKEIFDLVDVAYSHVSDAFYIASYGSGVLVFKDQKVIQRYDDQNSPLFNMIPGQNYIRAMEIEADPAGNIWIANATFNESVSILHKLSPDGNWTSFKPELGLNSTVDLYDLRIDHKNNLWFTIRGRSGVYVYNPEKSGRKWRNLSANPGSGNLPNANVLSIEVDLNGDVWFGTNMGIGIFKASGDPFQDDAMIPYFDGLPLLMDKSINDIDVDGANRKWVATNDGAWLFNEDASEALEYFSAGNSPLADSDIKDVEVGGNTGDVFFLTNYGLYSYRSTATEATEQGENKARVFPNPVRSGYSGPIGISGLARNASVKITDIYGNMVYETIATGGTAVWDGNNYNGTRARSGVYLVFSATIYGDKGNVAKIVLTE